MLVELTPYQDEIDRRKSVALENKFEFIPQCDEKYIVEKGIYQCTFPFNFCKEEFIETKDLTYDDRFDIFDGYEKSTYGVADNIDQIKEYYKEEVESDTDRYAISLTPVFQERENKGKGGGWRWHKWGVYIGELDRQCEYLDDEDFGDDFKYVITFQIYKLKNEE